MTQTVEQSRSGGSVRLFALLFGLSLGPLTYALLTTAVIPVIPQLSAHYDVLPGTANLVVTVALIAGAVATPLLGRLGDLFGRRQMLLLSLVLLLAGCLLAAVSTSFPMLLVARFLQGPGCASVPLGLAVIADLVPPRRLNYGIGVASVTYAVGAGAGFILGGVVATLTDDVHAVFWVLTAAAAVALVVSWKITPVSPPKPTAKVDLLGGVLLTVGLTGSLLALAEGGHWGWTSATTVVCTVGGVACLALWIVHGFRAADPLVDMHVFFSRPVLVTNVATLLLGAAQFVIMLSIVVVGRADPATAGYGLGLAVLPASLLLLPPTIAQASGSAFLPAFVRRFSLYTALVVGSALSGAGLLLVSVANRTMVGLLLAAAVSCVGFGFAVTASPAYVVSVVEPSQRGITTGMNFICRTGGQAIGTAGIAALITATTPLGSSTPSILAYEIALRVVGVGGLLSAVLLLVARPDRPRRVAPAAGVRQRT